MDPSRFVMALSQHVLDREICAGTHHELQELHEQDITSRVHREDGVMWDHDIRGILLLMSDEGTSVWEAPADVIRPSGCSV